MIKDDIIKPIVNVNINMLAAQKSFWFERVFSIYNRNLIKRRFESLRVLGFEEREKCSTHTPLVIYANHSSWWDGLVAFEISRKANLDGFIMMEEKQLKKFPLFRKLGAFSVVRENPRKALESINYAAEILKENAKRALWIFPQGEILPNDKRPIRFFNGMSRIIEKVGKIQSVPIAIRYEFLNEFKPEIFIKVGKINLIEIDGNLTSKKLTVHFAENLTGVLDELGSEIKAKNFKNFKKIL